ncbi:hypothetical protein C5167_043849 [Papaver somniferum]|uniref:Leucine-rich repeat-containing N-terminal plant-type domain-containing protein n=1 Tax=Papaver somniferum TaxID=3469 RepID=A0A4Y7L7X4_PAPSO|nr:receptor-like protein 37 [Papaver somniferum]RZC81296.1 hypothetical protein C5167_043849 [Papaver somniferum]
MMRNYSIISLLCVLVCLRSSSLTLSILDPLDFLALQSIRKTLEDLPGSDFFTSWDFTSDPCGFSGVYCDEDSKKVIALNLGDPRAGAPGLTGRIHPSIGKLSSLAEFSIVPGRIYGVLPPTISKLKNLKFLAVSKNFISGAIPDSISEIPNLRTLDLSYNQLNGSIPGSLGTLPFLSSLILCHNHLTGSVPTFGSQTLTRLDLKHNHLTGLITPSTLPTSLQFLSLSQNNLTGPVDRVLLRLNRLNYLDLSMNRFVGAIPASIFTFPLTNLQLQRNQFTGQIRPLDQVSIPTVDLSHNNFGGQISSMFSSVQNLFLNNNKFIGEVPNVFVDKLMAEGIQILYLQHNFLSRMEIDPTAEIPVSTSLCLQYNCMVPPVQTPCPFNAGTEKARPTTQCMEWRG